MSIEKINLAEKLSKFNDHWHPRLIGELNGQHVKIAKIKGEFIWHKHDREDELFLVLKGSFRMELRDKKLELSEGDMVIIPRGIEHRPVADDEASILLFEPAGVVNTGDQAPSELTRQHLEAI